MAGGRRADAERRADNHDIAHHDRGRCCADHAGLDVVAVQAVPQIDDSVGAESRIRHAGLGVQLDEMIAGRDEQDALVAMAIGPIRDAAIVESHRVRAALAFVIAIHPQRFARGRIDRYHIAPDAGGEIQNAAAPSAA